MISARLPRVTHNLPLCARRIGARSGNRCAVSPAWSEFAVDAAFVVDGSADVIRGLIVSEPARVVLGLVLIAVVLALFTSGSSLGRTLLRWTGANWRLGRGLVALAAVPVVAEAVQPISAVSDHDWGSCLFHAVRSATTLGVVVCCRVAPIDRRCGIPAQPAMHALTRHTETTRDLGHRRPTQHLEHSLISLLHNPELHQHDNPPGPTTSNRKHSPSARKVEHDYRSHRHPTTGTAPQNVTQLPEPHWKASTGTAQRARDGRAMDADGVLLTGATRRLPPAQAVEPERGFEPLTCSLRDHSEADDDEPERT